MRKHFYSHLLDDDSVNHFDNVMGVNHNLFFINHDIKEESVEDILSKSNVHEAEYCLALANYFFQQGYEASCITILTTYTGQVLNLKGKLRDKRYACLDGIYVTAVDNYQGEENDIILLSLVRSNEAGNIGFLKVSNRMCVALSRARKGLFCIGNFTLLAEKNDLWMKIVNDMRSSGRIKNHLLLHCHNHPATKVKAFIAKDFEKCPLGGCNRMCETRLECGHVCPRYCHPKDPHHEKYECREPCVRTCDRKHPCNSLCFEKCPPCRVIICKILLDCSHEASVQCAKYNQSIDCMEPCERTLKCGHKCRLKCFQSCTLQRCLEIVNKSFDPCGHDIQVKCYINSCQLPCEKLLTCGHDCQTKCGDMCTEKCRKYIDKTFQCGHTVNVPCFTPSCILPCSRESLCGHPCLKLCGESCGDCFVKIRKELLCGHLKMLFCYKNVKSATCKEICTRALPCGHPCMLRCNEKCDATLCTRLVKKKLKCEHEKELPCNINIETLYKNKDRRFRYAFSRLPNQIELLNCNVEVIKALKCGHEITIECCKSSHIDKIKCNVKVIETLDCGHDVTRECSKIGLCSEMCSRLLSCGHKCLKLCGESCGDCFVKVRKELLCGHLKMLFCYKTVESATCKEMCTRTLPCGHPCMLRCYETCDAKLCTRLVKKKLKCEHEKELPCNINLETLYKNRPRDRRFRYEFSRLPNQIELLNCNVEVIQALKCGHEITIECCKSSHLDKIKCKVKVTETLDCGHDVTRECSKVGLCSEMCSRLLTCGHKCKDACANPCTKKCTEIVKKKLKCGHNKNVRCYVDVTENVIYGEAACYFKTKIQLPCGHEETQLCCHSYLPVICSNRCSKKLLCGHFCMKKCSQECSIDSCKQVCNATLACGHKCKGNCTSCSHGRIHTTCSQICINKLICGHIGQQICSITPYQPCKKRCSSRCPHRKCLRVCAEICAPCKSPCEWKCPHLKCTNACGEMCNRDRCNKPCRKTLRCKHKCLGLCGEPCLRSCLKCDPVRYLPATAKGNRPKYVYLYDCSHAVEVLKMDAYMDKDEGSRQKECPICHTTIIYNTRYGNVLKRIDVKITSLKHMACAQRSMQQV
ncbi:NFX1-type zinc finger-containing protein 1 homolog [Anneissia japonica]|uniref:NFX1-type zinc finger-containing protein 1 homolog n=1 Tax=Anneissia japonica TaxID=1529436 RepID=UPI001425B011|nr:NFX1-type zinc finger-containing protein 1 homolog [Anneissia japonica]